MGENRLASHSISTINEPIAVRVHVWIVDLGRISYQDDFRSFRYASDYRLHLMRGQLLRFIENEETPSD